MPQAAIKLAVNGRQVQTVIKGQQHISNHQKAQGVAHNKLKLTKVSDAHGTRNRDKGYAGKGYADHSKGHHIPFGIFVCHKESCIIRCLTRGKIRDAREYTEIYE